MDGDGKIDQYGLVWNFTEPFFYVPWLGGFGDWLLTDDNAPNLDTDSNPDYLTSGIIQLGKNYEGGYYRVYQKDKSFYDYKTFYGDLILSNCKYPHEVTKVIKGERKSLVFFISRYNGKNKRVR